MSHADLRASGLSESQIVQLVTSGRLRRIRRGYYARGPAADRTVEHRLAISAAAKAQHPGAVFSHVSAAVLHGLPLPAVVPPVVTVTRSGTSGGRRGGAANLIRAPLSESEITVVDGFAVTTLARTAADLGRRWPRDDALPLVDQVLARGVDRSAILDIVDARPCRGNAAARWLIGFADGRSESYYESLTRLRMHEQGVPPPELQYEVRGPDGQIIGRTDFAWPTLGVLGEFDGRVKYSTLLKPGQTPEDALMREKLREESMCRLGWWFVRFVTADCYREMGVRQAWLEAVRTRRGALGTSSPRFS